MNDIKPIETQYKGYRFRSRLEARWAVFFDSLKVVWEYEKEGYQLPDGSMYLPDFYLHDVAFMSDIDVGDIWVEIKGVCPTETEFNKSIDLTVVTSVPCFVFFGIPPGESNMKIAQCSGCGLVKIQPTAISTCQRCGGICSATNPKLIVAAGLSKSARFEHGEKP